ADKPEISGVLDRVAASLARFWDYNLMSPVKVDGPKHCGAQDAKCLKERVD
ncbi:MAG: hypothetical protein HY748_16495, partial [Elusimicrobia bacterium]|nr:hypothetical protein [Elusimicrobiota bacterium]